MKVGYDFHPEAETDLTDIWDYIAANSPEAADRVIDAILKRLESLVKFPLQGHKRTDLTSRPLRFVKVYEYLIAYAPDDDPLWVRCHHARQAKPAGHGSVAAGARISVW